MDRPIVTVEGQIEHGRHLGHTMGIPTINISPEEGFAIREKGVYFSRVTFLNGKFSGRLFEGMSNVGSKPTVKDTDRINIETYIYDFDSDVYGDRVKVELLSFRRGEKKFASLDELKAAISQDIEAGRQYFKVN